MKKRRHTSWLYLQPALLLVLFMAVMMTTIIYMAKCNEYHNTLSYYLNISRALHSKLIFFPMKKSNLLRLMNLFSLSFIGCLYLFGLHLLQDALPRRYERICIRSRCWVCLLAAELVIYDPFVYTSMYIGAWGFVPEALAFRNAYDILQRCTQVLHIAYMAVGFVMILIVVVIQIKSKGWKSIVSISIALSYAFIAVLYESLFFDLPFPALWISRIAGNYVQYNAPQIGKLNTYIALSPLFASLIAAWILILLIVNERLTQSRIKRTSLFQGATQTAEFSSRIFTHYIKNQIVAISAEINQLYDMPEDYLQHLDNVTEHLESMKQRINELAQRMQGIHLQYETCNITSLLLWAVENNRKRAGEIELVFEKLESAEMIICDAAMTREVFSNILTNAIEALQGSQQEKKYIVISMSRRYETIRITFADNGPGISGDPDRLFTPFYTSKKSYTNWGVGLSFCRRIVEAHGGSIAARNRLAGGAVFEIDLPIRQEE